MLSPTSVLTLAEARALVRRAVDKAEDLNARGAFVVVDDGGIVVSASRMDGAGAIGIPVSRAKAYEAAANRETSAQFAERMAGMFVGIYMAYQDVVRDRTFPGAGAVPIRQGGAVVGAMSTGASVGPFVKFEGLDPVKLIVDGKPTNAEDLIISYALGVPYSPQHGDDLKRWVAAYGAPPNLGPGTGLAKSPAATRQAGLASAIRMVDAAVAEAGRRNARVAVAVTDRHGDLVQIDRMDDAAPMTPDVAEAVAVTALNFRAPSGEVAKLQRDYPDLARLPGAAPFKYLPIPGGVPVARAGRIVGAVGVSGADPAECEAIAAAALAAVVN
jgi:uncharacterized protein GlcG (DUF336 family)